MANSNRLNVSRILRFCLFGAILWGAPSLLSSQEDATPHQRNYNVSQSFSELNSSLSNAANALLADATRASSSASEQKQITGATNIISTTDGDRHSLLLRGVSLTSSELRLNLLRPAVEPILRNYGVPVDLAAVIVVESAGSVSALSLKGARGLWQLMPDTARRYGLRVDEFRDDRLDLFKSTDAAARYLHDLYMQFGDWKLVLAAYNTGEAHLGAAILKAHVRDFDQLASMRMLPLETRNYVPRVLAAAQHIGTMRPLESHSGSPSAREVFASSNP